MGPKMVKRNRRPTKVRRLESHAASRPAPTAATGQPSSSTAQDSVELPSRKALVARLEAQRAELLRAMSCVNLARGTIEQHVAKPPLGGEPSVTPEQHALYRQRVLEALTDAAEALRSAYPMLERIAQALAVDEMLKEHTPTSEPSASASAGTASKTEPSQSRRAAR